MANPSFLPRCIFAAAGFLSFMAPAHAQDVLWERSCGGRHSEFLTDAIPTADYGFLLAGSSLSGKTGNKSETNNGNLDYWIWKMDEKGELEWQKSFGGNGSDFLQSIKATIDGGFILAGTSNSGVDGIKKDSCRGNDDIWIIKLNAKGGEEWQKTIGGMGQEKMQSISQTRDGGYILGCSTDSFNSGEKDTKGFGGLDYWVLKLDNEGKIEWQRTFGGIYLDEIRSIVQTADNGYLVGGYSNSPQSGNKSSDNIGTGDYWVIKLDQLGETEWEKAMGGDQDDQIYCILQTYDGGYLLAGNSASASNNSKAKGNGKGTDFWVVKLDSYGEPLWQQTYDFGYSDMLSSIIENRDHTLLVAGYAKSESEKDKKGINDYIALKISEKGDVLWDVSVGSDGDDALKKLIETRDGGYLLAGTSNPVRAESGRSRLQKANPKGNSGKPAVQLGNGQGNKGLSNATSKANEQIDEAATELNEEYSQAIGGMTDHANKTAGSDKDSSLQYGINKPQGSPIGKTPSLGTGGNGSGDAIGNLMDGMSKKQARLPASGDKKINYGGSDFWVVKLKDKDKPLKERSNGLEAIPNPTDRFANVIVNYEFESGTGTIADLSGHILETFAVKNRTIPIDLGHYPEGIYVVNIKTDLQSDGVKIIKRQK